MTPLERLTELLAKSTPCQWTHSERWVEPPQKRPPISYCGTDETGHADAALIVAMREALPKLLAAAKILKKTRRKLSQKNCDIDGVCAEIDAALAELNKETI